VKFRISSALRGNHWLFQANGRKRGRYSSASGTLATPLRRLCSSALIHSGLGEKERALEILEAGCEQRQSVLVALKVHPAYDDLRSEPRFNAILKRIGFNPD
jgi:hypothetical protein